MKRKLIILLATITYAYQCYSQSFVMGNNSTTQIKIYEYYHHTGESKWVKLFRIYNYSSSLGFWGKGGVSGSLYYVDYQGEGASKVDFVFPQSIQAGQKPNLIACGNASRDFNWYAQKNTSIEGQESYDVYIKTSPWHVGFTFQLRGADYEAFFVEEDPPSQNWIWNTQNDQSSIFYLSGNLNIGIGTTDPKAKLDVRETGSSNGAWKGRIVASGENNAVVLGEYNGKAWFGAHNAALTAWSDLIMQADGGNLGIGTTAPDQKLTVKGKIHAEEVIVDLNVPVADYVFAKDYDLMPLHKVEQYVQQNSHLPDIPSASEIKEHGLSMGEMQNKLLKKIEELTLYVIEQNKFQTELETKLAKQENQYNALLKQLEFLTKKTKEK